MDFIKTLLIIAIATTLYYLLLQWPAETISNQDGLEEYNEEKVINDSKDSLSNTFSPMEEVVVPNKNALEFGEIYEV